MAPLPQSLLPRVRPLVPALLLISAACQQSEPTEPRPEPVSLARNRQGLRPPLDTVGDIFLGQALPTLNGINLLDGRGLSTPDGVALDTSVSPPRVYVADTANSRVLAWANATAFANGAPADKVIGQIDPYHGSCNATGLNASSLCNPRAVEVDGSGNLYVADTGNNRVLEFNTPFTTDSVADHVYGQSGNFGSSSCNLGGGNPGASNLCSPVGVAVDSAGNLYVSDQGNHRVLRFTSPLTDTVADTVLGQTGMTGNTANLVDARGLANPSRVAIDRSVTPNRIYVTDTGNHRVLGWSSATGFANGAPADKVIGQPNTSANGCNTGGAGPGTLCSPRGLAVDAAGNLYVADTTNNRVLVFDTPFTSDALADKVWGQTSFTSTGCNSGGVGPATLCGPWDVALDAAGNLLVSDPDNDRVLFYTGGRAGDTTADKVLGQPSFTATGCGAGPTAQSLCTPRGMAFDAAGNLFVADYDNARVLVYTAASADTVADAVLGQASMTGGSCNATGTNASSLCDPGSVAVDGAGNVWVGDEGNSRVLGYLTPLTTDGVADKVVGKSSLTSSSCTPASATCIRASSPAVALDASNNLYVADPANNRVLAYNAPFATGNDTTADRVLGQADFLNTARNSIDAAGLDGPAGLHVDRSSTPNRIYVADAQNSRVLAWSSVAFTNGQLADRIFGQAAATQGTCNGSALSASTLCTPADMATDAAGNLYITDANARVLEYDAPFATGGEVADRVFGQATFTSSICNSGGISALTLCAPYGIAVAPTGQVFVVDGTNQRLLRYDSPLTTDTVADAVLGQLDFRHNGSNLVDGAGLNAPYAVAIDASVTPNRLYVADETNHRVLAWADVSSFQNGSPADLVLGQPDLLTTDCNGQGTSASSLCGPSAVAVDASGRVYVSDSDNDRVLLYLSPFTTDTVADKVIGQASFTGDDCNRNQSNPSSSSLCGPTGLTVGPGMQLFISDEDNSRVLVFLDPWTTDTIADTVFGQLGSFTTKTCNRGGRSATSLCTPEHVALDTSVAGLRLYVTDSGNNRVLEYDSPLSSDTTADFVIGQSGMTTASCNTSQTALCDPKGIAVDTSGNIYVADNDNDRVVQYNSPRTTDASADRVFGQTSFSGSSCNAGGVSATSLCGIRDVALDAVGHLYVADTSNNRVVVYLANNRPTALSLTLTPAAPKTTDDLVGGYNYQDADNDPQSGTEVRWYRNGQEQPALFGLQQVPASATTRGEQWYFTVRPRDGQEFGRVEKSPTVTIVNTAPAAATLAISPSPPRTDDTLTASYAYSDADNDTESGSEIRWFLNGVEQPTLFNQNTVPASVTTRGQLWYFTVRPRDGSDLGAAVTSPVATIVNTPPSASNVQITPASPNAGSNLNTSYLFTDADNDVDQGSEIRWYRNGVLQPAYNDLRTVPGPLTGGDLWYYTLRPKDGAALGALVTSTTVVVGGSAPTVTNVRITPSPLRTDDVMTASYSYSDPDGQLETNSQFRWFKNGVEQVAFANQKTVPASATTKGDVWYFTVTPCDSTAVCGVQQTAPSAAVLNTAPSAATPAITPASPKASDALTAGYAYTDTDNDTENGSEIRWFKNGVEQTALANLRTLPAGTAAKGQSWTFTARPKDGADFGAAVTSPPVTIANSAPSVSQAVLSPASPRVTDTLVATYTYSDPDGDAPASASGVRWFKDNVEDTTLRNTASVPPSKLAKGQSWRFTVTPSDGSLTGSTVTSNTVTIQNSPPVAANVAITPSTPSAGEVLTAAYAYADADGDAQSGSELRWFKNGVEQTSLFGASTVPAGVTAKGERWSFSIRPRDGTVFGAQITSAEISIANNVPRASSLAIQPAQPGTEDNLVAGYTYLDGDGDTESGTELRWFRNGVEVAAHFGLKTLPASATTKGESWYVTVKPKDGTDFGQLATSPPVLIFNSAPRATSVNLSPLSPKTTDALAASYTYVDPDDDTQQGTELRWFKNGTEEPSLFNQAIVGAGIAKAGETWYFTVRPKDGVAFGALVTSTSVIVGSSAPVATALQITPFTPTGLDALVANYLYNDPDGEPESGSEIEWSRDGTLLPALSGSRTVPPGTARKGEAWSFSVRPRDGASFGARQTSAPVIIGNTPPAATSVTVSPAQPRTDDVLTAAFTYGDTDGDPQSGSEIRWYRNGLEQPSLFNQPVVPGSATRKREVWYYRVRPKDGTDYGPAEVSSPAFIENSPPAANAGPDQLIPPKQKLVRVTLDGTGSQDADADVLDYAWAEGSTVLGRGAQVKVDLPVGKHTLTLTVGDGEETSTDEVLIDIPDPKPTATAPADFTTPPGRIVLTGGATDPLGRTPGYQWTQVSGAPVELRDGDKSSAWFLGTRAGAYTFELVATSDSAPSDPVRTTVTIRNLPPWASAPARQVVEAGAELSLDGSGSNDPNADALTWKWTVELGSTGATLADGDKPIARLTPLTDGRFGLTLVVNDGAEDSAPAFTEVIAINPQVTTHPPVANAGPDGVGELGKPVTLEGRGSYDVDGDALTYTWRRVSGPAEPPVPANSPTPIFRPAAAGTVVLGLTVSDGRVTSAEDTVTFEIEDPAENRRPVARAGSDRAVVVGSEVQLDGTRSADPDGDVLTYQWTQLSGPRVTLDNNRSPRPTFVPTRPGFVRFGLTVSDGKAASAPSSVLLQVTTEANQPPVASAGADQRVTIGGVVTLDGSASSDPDGNTLRYVWEQLWGSPVVLGSPGEHPTFKPPGQGRYRFRLTVWDAETPSAPDEVDVVVSTHGVDNKAPVAVTSGDVEVSVGDRVELDGSGSHDEDPLDKLAYEWTVSGFPTGSEPQLADAGTASPSFTPAVAGAYTVRLRVSDGDLASAPAYVTILVKGDSKGGLGCGAGSGAPLPLAAVLLALVWGGRRRVVAMRGAGMIAARALAVLLALGVALAPALSGAVAKREGTTWKRKATPGKTDPGKTAPGKTAPDKSSSGKGLSGKKKKKPALEAPVELVPLPVEEASPEPAQPAEEPSVTPDSPRAAPAPAEAAQTEGPPNPYLDEARQLYLGFQFEGIIPKLEFALAVKGVTPAQKIEIFKLMALTHSAFDDAPKAEEAFLHILELKPDYELTGGASPKIRSYFSSAQKTYRARQAVKLQHAPPKPSTLGETTTVDVTVVAGADRVEGMTLHYRPRGSTSGYSQLSMARGENGAFSGNVPNAFPGPAGKRTIEYFARARDASGGLLASVGSEETPLELTMETVALAASQPLYKSWVFWTAVGVGAAAAIATPVMLNRSAQVRPGSLGMEPLK